MTLYARDGMSPTDPQSGALIDLDNAPTLEIELDAAVGLVDGMARIVPSNPARWRAALGRMVGRRITVTLSREKERRSGAANRYLWALYTCFVEEMRAKGQDEGWTSPFRTTQDAHDWAKFRFLGAEVVRAGTVDVERPSSTTRLDTAQFHTFTTAFKNEAARMWGIDMSDVSDRE